MSTEPNPWAISNWSVPNAEWHSSDLPLVTFGVLNYNRKENLRETLDVLSRAILYPKYEIIVVDNGSSDGSLEMVAREYPEVRIHAVGENRGISSRNMQAKLANGKYLFSFDDDTFPATPAMVLRIVQHMEANPSIAAVSSTYYQPRTGVTETGGWEFYRLAAPSTHGYPGIFVVEGGVCFRLDSLRKVEGYDRSFLVYGEGMDLGIQLFKQGLQVYLCPWFATLHLVATSTRPPGLRAYSNSRHVLWMIAKHWRLPLAVPLLLCYIGRRIVAMIMRRPTAAKNARGVWDGIRDIRPFLRYSPKLTWKQSFMLGRFYLFMFRWA